MLKKLSYLPLLLIFAFATLTRADDGFTHFTAVPGETKDFKLNESAGDESLLITLSNQSQETLDVGIGFAFGVILCEPSINGITLSYVNAKGKEEQLVTYNSNKFTLLNSANAKALFPERTKDMAAADVALLEEDFMGGKTFAILENRGNEYRAIAYWVDEPKE